VEELIHRRCRNHRSREAVARCPQCGRFFCRECITEHEDRVLCTACLDRLMESDSNRRAIKRGKLVKAGQLMLGVFLLWMCFYYFGQMLLLLPTAFHEGTLWHPKQAQTR
jgi:hypothetical protein